MVSKTQKLARKRFKAEHPDLFPKVDPTPPKDPNRVKKKKSSMKRKKGDSGRPVDPSKRGFGKHPLRVPGMKPGESCFICKARDHIAKLCPEKAEWERNKICLLCRQRGHSLKRCPGKNGEATDTKMCYNCGESGHSLGNCTQPLRDGGTKFASCFICKQKGHISKDCPQNLHGIYPKGGCCKICGGVTHLARDCPDRGNRNSGATGAAGNASFYHDATPRGRVTKFTSGDDLEDDFTKDDKTNSNKNNPLESIIEVDPVVSEAGDDSLVKQKKKKGPKVVNFVG